ncbi:MAG: hypothetical protein ACRDYA_14575 [Egibacteraceae bacterium]
MMVTPVTNVAAYPVDVTYTSQGGPLLIQFAGSAWAKAVGIISVNLTLDGATVATAKVYTNEATSHKALVPAAVFTCSIKPGPHKFAVAAGDGNTNIDHNDFFTITVFEFSLD